MCLGEKLRILKKTGQVRNTDIEAKQTNKTKQQQEQPQNKSNPS